MREWVAAGASIPSSTELETDLTALRYEYRGSLLLIESKQEAKKRGVKSPDFADSLALTFAYPPKQADRNEPATQAWQAIDQLAGY
jgi:phage terminase large subunit